MTGKSGSQTPKSDLDRVHLGKEMFLGGCSIVCSSGMSSRRSD
jgi:hypothetical protein